MDGRFVSECVDETAFSGVAAEHAKYDVVVNATAGSPAGLSLVSGLRWPMGMVVIQIRCAAGERLDAAPFVIDELKVIGRQ